MELAYIQDLKPAIVISCGFKSHYPHNIIGLSPSGKAQNLTNAEYYKLTIWRKYLCG